jgi:hypothetical protein
MLEAVEAPRGEIVEREIPGLGLLRFEDLPAGAWLTQKGEPAKKPRRRYLLNGRELDSVSSIVGTLSKEALINWAEDHGARGAVLAERAGLLKDVPDDEIVAKVRDLDLGARAVAREAADRGKVIHTVLDRLATTGETTNPADLPAQARPWARGAAAAWVALGMTDCQTEVMVCSPGQGYAGRFDLYGRRKNGRTALVDWKTGRGKVFDSAHYQTRGYVEALPSVHLDPPDEILIVGIDDKGNAELISCEIAAEDWAALVHTFRSRKRANAGMAKQRKAARRAAKLAERAALARAAEALGVAA